MFTRLILPVRVVSAPLICVYSRYAYLRPLVVIDAKSVAEALVGITAVERKATRDAGTVGGPIDVALITRSEGFVWIKRKHHFSAELNPRYISRVRAARTGGESR